MLYQAHRGVQSEFPENTLVSFRAAVLQGYDIIELDPAFTSDGVCVVFHDDTINRTLRMPNCGPVSKDMVRISDVTFERLTGYSAGVYRNWRFKDERVPTLAEALECAKPLTVKIDNKIFRFTDEQRSALFDIAENSGTDIRWTCGSTDDIRKILDRFPGARIDYDGAVTPESINAVVSLCSGSKDVRFWMPVDSPRTAWAKVPRLSKKLADLVHRYGSVGAWLLDNDEELAFARECGADVIETTGSLKPAIVLGGFVDCHIHSTYSHDGTQSPEDILETAKRIGLAGFAITDHDDCGDRTYRDSPEALARSAEFCCSVGFSGKPFALAGVEIGDGMKTIESVEKLISEVGYDIIGGSAHYNPYPGYTDYAMSRIDFSKFTQTQIDDYIDGYFRAVSATIDYVPCDVVCHLTSHLRYIKVRYGREVDMNRYMPQIESILRRTIDMNLCLEVNTSSLHSDYGDEMCPDEDILRLYYSMGGRKLTLGSDAHKSDRIGYGFKETWEKLRKIGFDRLYYVRERIPVPYIPY